jgi:hypothetical protein
VHELAREVLDMHAGTAVDLGRELPREHGDPQRSGLDDRAFADHHEWTHRDIRVEMRG